jgi:hypothetical protein
VRWYTERAIIMGTYRNHFDAKPLPGVTHRITPRARRIRELLDDRDGYRLLRTTHIVELLKYYFREDLSEQTTARYLRWLMDEGEVIRIRRDPDSKTVAEGSLPKIYGLNSPRNRALNERIKSPSYIIPHTLSIADTMVWGVVQPCRMSHGRARFIDAPEIVQSRGSAAAKAAAKPYTLPVEVVYRNKTYKCSLTPDRLFSVYFPARDMRWFFALEEDKSTEPHERGDYAFNSGTSLFRKFLTYCFIHHMKVLLDLYNIPGFRILFVTDSEDRIKHVQEIWKHANDALKEFQKQAGIDVRPVANNVLLCITRPVLRAGTIFTVPWTNGRGDKVTIDIPQSAAPHLSRMG